MVGIHHRGLDLDPQRNPRIPKLNKAVRIDRIIDRLCSDTKSKPYAEKILGRGCSP